MNKTVDLNEREFQKEKEDFKQICRVFEIMLMVASVFFVLGAIVVAIITVAMDFHFADAMVLLINTALLTLGAVSAMNFGRAIFKTLKSGETPFRYDIADKVKGAALALLVSGALGILVQAASHLFSEAFGDVCHYFMFAAVGGCFVGTLLGVMSYVMSYGCRLQQESDETI